jgi:PST family polysaccharide transporter
VAEAVGSNDREKIGKVVITLRRICWLTGTVGSLAVVFLAQPLSRITFGTTEHAWALVLLAWIILMRNIQSAQMAYLKGLRRIGDLARLKIIGAVAGATIGVGFYAWLRLDGIVPALLILALLNLAASWWFARKVPPPQVLMPWKESFRASGGLLRLGFAFMWTGFLTTAVAYFTRLMIIQNLDLHAVGIFQSAFRLSGIFVGFVLMAMSTDYFPRLAAVSSDNEKMNKMVNEQSEMGLLLAVPGLLCTLTFAPWIIRIFYTAEFAQSAELLKWFVLGCLGRVISWPMGFVMLAKGKSLWLIGTETFFNFVHIVLIWIGLVYYGIIGVSIAFFFFYVSYTIVVALITRHLSGFTWNSDALKLLITMSPVVGGLFLVSQFMQETYATIIGSVVTCIVGIYCLKELIMRLGPEHRLCRIAGFIPVLRYFLAHKRS